MRTIGGRPVLMQRFPHGAEGSSFFQKRVPDNAPDWLETTIVSTPNGTTSRALVAADLAHIVWAVNLGCLGFHVWPSLASDPDHADELRIDLDPHPGSRSTTFVRPHATRKRCSTSSASPPSPRPRATAASMCTCGSQPRWDSLPGARAPRSRSRASSRAAIPTPITDAWWKEERGERIFVDFNQNAPHKTIFGAWCVRARPGAQVSTPFDWSELDDDRSRRDDDRDRARARQRARRPVGRHGRPIRSRSSRCSRCRSATSPTGCTDAPWPPVYPKMPGEPPRVAPSRAKKTTKKATKKSTKKATK